MASFQWSHRACFTLLAFLFFASSAIAWPVGAEPIVQVPAGLGEFPTPSENPLSAARIALGKRLFSDPILSSDGTVSCASCHQPGHGFSSPVAVSPGVGGRRGRRNVPTLFNRAFGQSFFWDGRETTLESQALRPIESSDEMGSSVAAAVHRLTDRAEYRRQFADAFPDGLTATNLGRALATFERTLLSGDSPVDRFRDGALAALDDHQRHGLWLYESRAGCWRCHGGANYTDEGFHNTGVGWGKTPPDLGRFEITGRAEDRGRFKTPTLRGLMLTAPYMHDGSLATLEEVVAFYNRGGGGNPNLDPALKPLLLSPEEAADLVAFLRALSPAPP